MVLRTTYVQIELFRVAMTANNHQQAIILYRSEKSFAVKGELPDLTEIRRNFFEYRRKGKPFPQEGALPSSMERRRRTLKFSQLVSVSSFLLWSRHEQVWSRTIVADCEFSV